MYTVIYGRWNNGKHIYFPMRKIRLISYFFNLLAKTNKMGFLTDSLLLWAMYRWLGICRAEYNAPPSKNLSILHKGWIWVHFAVLLSRVWFFSTPWTEAHQASLSFTISRILLELMSIESVMSSKHLILFCPLLFLPSLFHSIRVFSNENLHIWWPNYWNFSISLSNEYSGLISFRIDWFDLLAVQSTLKSLLQNHSSKASILLCLALLMVQNSHPYMTTGKP